MRLRRPDRRPPRRRPRDRSAGRLFEPSQQLQREQEHERRVPLRGDLDHRGEDTELHGRGMPLELARRPGQGLGRLELALGVDHLRPSLPLRLRLSRHRPAHRLRQLDVLHLHEGHLDPPGVGEVVDDLLEAPVDVVPVDQDLVQVYLADHAPKGGLSHLRRAEQVVLDGDRRPDRLHHVEVRDRVHPDGHVVPGDDVLRRDVHRHRLEVHLHHPVHDGDDEEQPGALGPDHSSEPEDHASLVLLHDPDRRDEDHQRKADGCQDPDRQGAHPSITSSSSRGSTASSSPSIPTTRIRWPGARRPRTLRAPHHTPCTFTCAVAPSATWTVPVDPTMAPVPLTVGAVRARQATRASRTVPPPRSTPVGTSTTGSTPNWPRNRNNPPRSTAAVPPAARTPMPGTKSSATNRMKPSTKRIAPTAFTGRTDSPKRARTIKMTPTTAPPPIPGLATSYSTASVPSDRNRNARFGSASHWRIRRNRPSWCSTGTAPAVRSVTSVSASMR